MSNLYACPNCGRCQEQSTQLMSDPPRYECQYCNSNTPCDEWGKVGSFECVSDNTPETLNKEDALRIITTCNANEHRRLYNAAYMHLLSLKYPGETEVKK